MTCSVNDGLLKTHDALLTPNSLTTAAPFSDFAPEGFADRDPLVIAGSDLTTPKARMLLMACLMKFGSTANCRRPQGSDFRRG